MSRRARLAIVAAVAAMVLGCVYALVTFTPLALLVDRGPDLPTDGIVAVASGSGDWIGGDDRLAGEVRLDGGCVTVATDDDRRVVAMFHAGAATVDDELIALRWKEKDYAEGERVVLDGEAVGAMSKLPDWHIGYYVPGGCLVVDDVFLVNDLPG